MDKEILTQAFTNDAIPEYKCPHCAKGVFRLHGEFKSQETEVSSKCHGEDWWEIECVELLFSCAMKCSSCFEIVFVVGNGVVEEEHDIDERGEWKREWVSYYRPVFFHPPLRLIAYPHKAPKNVTSPLNIAGALFFSSPALCANAIRASAEEILTWLGVPTKKRNKFISFGDRLGLLPAEQISVKELFDAIRWIGNHGSHPGSEVMPEDAIHALEIMEFLLEEVYGERKKELKELAAAINSHKGPLGRLYRALE